MKNGDIVWKTALIGIQIDIITQTYNFNIILIDKFIIKHS